MVKKKSVRKKKSVHPVSGLTDVEERARCKAAIRYVWSKTSRVKHIKDVRFKHPDPNSKFTYAVMCVECKKMFGQSETIRYKPKTGKRKYKKTGVYHVDHISEIGMPSVNDIRQDLGAYAEELIRTPLRILCIPCHKIVTAMQVQTKFGKK